jgi:hypothetical protein
MGDGGDPRKWGTSIAHLPASEVQLSNENWQSVKGLTHQLLDEIKTIDDLVHSSYTKLETKAHINSIIRQILPHLPACYDDHTHNQKMQGCLLTYPYCLRTR